VLALVQSWRSASASKKSAAASIESAAAATRSVELAERKASRQRWRLEWSAPNRYKLTNESSETVRDVVISVSAGGAMPSRIARLGIILAIRRRLAKSKYGFRRSGLDRSCWRHASHLVNSETQHTA
jgi:hypothetical protein